jgi:hypothetical protein
MQDVVKSMPEPLLHSEYTLGEELLHTEISWLHAKAQATDADVDMTVLEGTVKVVKALVQALDKRSVGCEGSPSLIQLLLEYYLFPEALQPRVDGAAASGACVPCAAVPSRATRLKRAGQSTGL